jgi:hypothetical protein
MTKFETYNKVKNCIETSSNFEELETSYNMLLLFKKSFDDKVLIKRLYYHYERAIMSLCGSL